MCRLLFVNKFGKFSAIISSSIFSPLSLPSPPPDNHITCVSVYLMVSHLSLRFCLLFFILFSCSLERIISIDQSSSSEILSSANSNLLLRPSNKFLNFSYCTLNSRISIKNSIFIDILYLMQHYHYTFL